MRSVKYLSRGAVLSALLLTSMPALAQGKADRAREAVAAARAKVEAMDKVTAGGDFPRLQAEARAQLRTAEEDLARMSKDKAIADANEASRLADTAMGFAQRQQAEDANAQRAQAETAAADAQQQAIDANARADAAERAAASAAADAREARSRPPVVIQQPPTTTVTTETVRSTPRTAAAAPKKRIVRKTVRRSAAKPAATVAERTTTTVTTTSQPH